MVGNNSSTCNHWFWGDRELVRMENWSWIVLQSVWDRRGGDVTEEKWEWAFKWRVNPRRLVFWALREMSLYHSDKQKH